MSPNETEPGTRVPHPAPPLDFAGLEFILLDIGGVLIRDDLVEAMYFWGHYKALGTADPTLTPARFFDARERLIRSGRIDWLPAYGRPQLGEAGFARAVEASWSSVLKNWDRLSPPLPGAIASAKHLASRTRLGIVANQPSQIRRTLQALGLECLFDVILIDAEVPFSKPDPRIFSCALARARVPASRALMVGDRIDSDILGAKRAGMKTVWLSGYQDPPASGAYPAAWAAAYAGSRRRVGPHNQHKYCSTLIGVAPDYCTADLASLAARGRFACRDGGDTGGTR